MTCLHEERDPFGGSTLLGMDERSAEREGNTPTCGGCGREVRSGEPTFFFEEVRYHVTCVPAEHASRALSLLGVKSC